MKLKSELIDLTCRAMWPKRKHNRKRRVEPDLGFLGPLHCSILFQRRPQEAKTLTFGRISIRTLRRQFYFFPKVEVVSSNREVTLAVPSLTDKQLAVELQAGVAFRWGLAGLLGQPVHLQAGLFDIPLRGDPVPLVIVERRG